MEHDNAGAAQLRGHTVKPTYHQLETPTHSVVVGQSGGDNKPTDDAAPPSAEP